MGSERFLVLLLVVERKGANYLVKAGPLGTAESEVSSEAAASLKSAALKDLPKKEQGTRLYEAPVGCDVPLNILGLHQEPAAREKVRMRTNVAEACSGK